jgi:molecular chaperone GrpE
MEEEKEEEKEPEKEEPIQPTIEELQMELETQKERYVRLLAEMENARKRMQKERHDMMRYAIENVITEFLSPLDNLENALSFAHQTSEETQNWAKGFEMILTQFKEVLGNHSVTYFQSEGMHFDPHMHEVIEMEETEKYREGTVIQEFIRGYKCGDRILRPARVKVAKKPTEAEEQVTETNKEKHDESKEK